MSKTTISATIVTILGFSSGALTAQLNVPVEGSDDRKYVELQIKAEQEFSVPLDVVIEEHLLNSEEVLILSVNEFGTYLLETEADIEAQFKADDIAIREAMASSGEAGAPATESTEKPGLLGKAAAAVASVATAVGIGTKTAEAKTESRSAAASTATPRRGQGCAYAEKAKINF
jgi:hypothetical protein